MSNKSDIVKNILQWMKAENWTCEEVKAPNYEILYSVTYADSTVLVGIEKSVERISIHFKADMNDDEKISYMLAPDSYDFWYPLKVNLMLMGINTLALPNHEKPQLIDLFIWIYFDGFTRDRFINSVIRIIDGMGLCKLMWKNFGQHHYSGTSKGNAT
jgi:hypothetical protein